MGLFQVLRSVLAMTVKSIDEVGALQREVLEILWRLGRATVHEVRDEMLKERDLA